MNSVALSKMGVIASSIRLVCDKLIVKIWDVTHWKKSHMYHDARVRIINEECVPWECGYLNTKPVYYQPLPEKPMPVYVPSRPTYNPTPQSYQSYNKCENGGCTNNATQQITMTAGTNSLQAKTCNGCYSSKKSKMEWDLRCYRSSYR